VRISGRNNPEHWMPVASGSHVLVASMSWSMASERSQRVPTLKLAVVEPSSDRSTTRLSPSHQRAMDPGDSAGTSSRVLSAGRGWFRHPRPGLVLLLSRAFLTDALKRLAIGLYIQKAAGLAISLYPSDWSLDLRTVGDSTATIAFASVLCHFNNHLLACG
jgi:hypothetical protein